MNITIVAVGGPCAGQHFTINGSPEDPGLYKLPLMGSEYTRRLIETRFGTAFYWAHEPLNDLEAARELIGGYRWWIHATSLNEKNDTIKS